MSRKKSAFVWVIIACVLLGIGVAALYILWPQIQSHTTLHLGDGVFTTRVAKTPDERDKGLGGVHNFRSDQALLLVFDSDDKWSISMKDMNFPIDIVWLNSDKQVVYIVKNAPPDSYPYEQFTSKQDARYVVELPAGTVAKKSIAIGAVASFDENNLDGVKL